MNTFKKFSALLLLFLVVAIVTVWYLSQNPIKKEVSPSPVAQTLDQISYQGKAGTDALTLLKEKAQVEQDNSGLVVSINGRKAESVMREYWAFYINGAMAPVGPADYKTKEADQIEWKIEKY